MALTTVLSLDKQVKINDAQRRTNSSLKGNKPQTGATKRE